jgi:hypothetical protein
MSAHLTEPVPNPGDRVPSLSKSTRSLVQMSMAKDVKDRFLTFEAMVSAIDECLLECGSKGTGTLRLLRKPLVLNKPQSKKQPSSDRIGKIETGKVEKAPTPSNGAQRDLRGTDESPAKTPTSQIPRSALGEGSPPTPPIIPLAPITKPVTTSRIERSKVFDEDPHAKLGIGVLPWIVLGFAVVGLIVWLLISN